MHGRAIAVITFFIRLSRCEVQRTANLLIEQNIAHWVHHKRIHAQRKLADIPRSLIRIQNLIQPLRVITGRLDHFAVLQRQLHILKLRTRIQCGRIKLNRAVAGFLGGTGKHLPIGNIPIARTGDRRHPRNTEREVRARPH